jgi:ATP-dependent protease ClpP protease subunit
MQNKMPYFTMKKTDDSVDIYIFGDIVAGGWKWDESDFSSYDLASQIKGLPQDAQITVHINSNGGDLKEGLGIYNVLKGRNVTTICEGFAASSASVIFCAGKTRIMNAASLLFIHNASMLMAGTADEMEKAAEDLRTITEAAKAAYREAGVNISDEELTDLMDNETWIKPESAVAMGFATEIATSEDDAIKNDAMQSIMKAVTDDHRVQLKKIMDDLARYLAENGADSPVEIAENAEGETVEETVETPAGEQADAQTDAPAEDNTTTSTPDPALVENKGFFGFH